MTYRVKEMFYSIQGEGHHAGIPSVFVRFAGCNLWSGREEDRERDAAKGVCARWCDTDFRGTDGAHGGVYSAVALADMALSISHGARTLILTGGEPALQVDHDLSYELRRRGFMLHAETNGTVPLRTPIAWVTLSPKAPTMPVVQRYDEVKVVTDGREDVERWRRFAPIGFIQPMWTPDAAEWRENTARCVEYVKRHPTWRLSIQIHKWLGEP